MSTLAAADGRSRTDELARLSPLVLLAVALPWLLERGIVVTVSTLAPAYEPLVTEGLADAVLYPVVTGSIVLAGLYALLDPAARRSLFLFRRPSRRELLAAAGAIPAGLVLQQAAMFAVMSLFGGDVGSTLDAELELGFVVVFVIVGGVFAPIVEEVLFRGLLLGYLVERGVPILVAAGIVVAAFGAIHLYGGSVYAVGAAAWAVVPIALRLRYDNLVSPVLVHSANNLIVALFLLLLSI